MIARDGPSVVWSIDTEWGFRGGRLECESAWEPVLFCAINVAKGERVHFWARDPQLREWLRVHSKDRFVAHYAIAEMKYLLRLGLPLPLLWFDTFVAYRLLTNRPTGAGHSPSPSVRAGLSAALHRFGLQRYAPAEKKALRMKIARLEFDHQNDGDRQEILDYCFSDCEGAAALYAKLAVTEVATGKQTSRVSAVRMNHVVEFLKAVSRMELRGMPFDVARYRQVLRGWPELEERLMEEANRTRSVYAKGVFKKAAFLSWCDATGIQWPVRKSVTTGKLYRPLDNDTFKEMEYHHPFIAEVRQLEKTRRQFGRRRMVVDEVTGRHYAGASVFRSVTGRNQPRQFVFSGPKWLRFLVSPESPDHVLVYTDYSAQEFGIAAALSGDPVMREVYEASDCHLAFAIRAGAAPPDATKETHAAVRKRYKTTNLGVLFGQTAHGIAARLGISHAAAQAIIDDHRKLFPTFWQWSERTVQGAFDRGRIVTPCGWRSHVPPLSNERTWMNWPMQSTGGDIMRLTITYLDRQNVRLLAPVHDGFLLSCRRSQLCHLRAAVDYACTAAVEHVLPGFLMRWDFTIYESRFEDEDGRPMWDRLQQILGGCEDAGGIATTSKV